MLYALWVLYTIWLGESKPIYIGQWNEMETFKLGKICHNIGIWALKLFFVLKFRVPIIKYCVKSYKLCCFTSISLCSRPVDPLIIMKCHRTVIGLHIKIMGWNWNIISNDQFSLSTWVQRVKIISDDIPWSYLYIHGVEIGLKIWNSEPVVSELSQSCLRVVSEWSEFNIL